MWYTVYNLQYSLLREIFSRAPHQKGGNRMKNRNVLATLAAVGLAASVATPAMALENEFHGLFSARYINSNFNRTATTDYASIPDPANPGKFINVGDGTYQPD